MEFLSRPDRQAVEKKVDKNMFWAETIQIDCSEEFKIFGLDPNTIEMVTSETVLVDSANATSI